MIILTAEQAEQVRGLSSVVPWAGLEPSVLKDGTTFILEEAVLTDPAHVDKRALLETLPTREVAPEEYPEPDFKPPGT